jgi:uncharacterized membrane protein YtjA (UPF0391 family)
MPRSAVAFLVFARVATIFGFSAGIAAGVGRIGRV